MILRSILFLTLLCASSLYAQDDVLAKTEISLLTCESGDELYSTFAHTALRLRNDSTDVDVVYNYGLFDFNTPNFYMKFLRGKLPYRLGAYSYESFLREYNFEQRSIYEQTLNLTDNQKIALVKYLQNNIRKENAFYKYDFFFDNCTTRTIDAIDAVTGRIEYNKPVEDITFRNMLKKNLTSMPWSEFGIDLIVGAVADQKTTRRHQHFLPLYLYEDMAQTYVVNDGMRQNLVSKEHLVLDFEAEKDRRRSHSANWPLWIFGAFLALEILLFFKGSGKILKVYDGLWFTILALMGIVMAIMWWGTEHMSTKQNYNLIWANLLYIPYLLIPNGKVKRLLAVILMICSGLAVANSLFQFLPQYFLPSFGLIAIISILKLVRGQKGNQMSNT